MIPQRQAELQQRSTLNVYRMEYRSDGNNRKRWGWPFDRNGNVTYYAIFSATINKYTVTWMNDTTQLEQDLSVAYGTSPSYDSATPTKAATAQYTYTFAGWSTNANASAAAAVAESALPSVTGDVTYYCDLQRNDERIHGNVDERYDDTGDGQRCSIRNITELWCCGTDKSGDGAVHLYICGMEHECKRKCGSRGSGKRTSERNRRCNLLCDLNETTNEYTVTWENYDGTQLEQDLNVAYGTTPSYDSATPTKPATAQYTYTFNGWSPTVSAVTGDITYTALYSEETNEYTVTWENYDGTHWTGSERGIRNDPSYDSATPTRAATAQYEYTFTGWSPTVDTVTGDITYTAQYSETAVTYAIAYVMNGGTNNAANPTTYTYGDATITLANPTRAGYTFTGWTPSNSIPTGSTVIKHSRRIGLRTQHTIRSHS